jgi:hypothetical protein
VIYQELAAVRRAGLAVIVTGLGLLGVDIASGFALHGWGVLGSIALLVVGIGIWSRAFYGRIVLTPTSLVIGRERLSPQSFDPAFGVQPITALSDRERALTESPTPIPKTASVRIVGGSFGRGIGQTGVVLRDVDRDKAAVVFCRRPDTLSPLLQEWLTRSEG